mmetsp:Transcript_55434/g.123847  ORF Transcript_55434/g.123847 Transcript_55434/m.123847 type:complete len:200 (+) Transcript_55434:244-843(+)
MCTVNTMTCSASLSMAASPLRATTSFWATTWTAESRAWRPSFCCSPTRSSFPRISSCCAGTTSVLRSRGSMVSMTSARGATTSSFGSSSATSSTACLAVPSSTRRSCACTVVFPPKSPHSTRSKGLCAPPMCLTPDLFATFFGQTLTRILLGGQKTIAECLSSLARTSSRASCKSMIWIWCAGPTKSSRMATSSLQSAN